MTATRRYIHTTTVNGKTFRAVTATTGERPLYEFDHPYSAGWVRILSCGQENVYFEFRDDSGLVCAGFAKCL